MATCNYIKAKKQNQSAMRAVIRYVSQDAKTLDENGYRYLSGINCIGSAAYDEFMATKNLYGKRSGVYYYHYEQSFAPGEIDDYDTAHKIGLRLAEEMFPGFEVLVGTHLDAHDDDGRQRVHNHFVINSVSYASGMKLDYGPYTIEKMRRISDRLCEEHALSVLPEFKQTFDGRSISTREYRAALKGDSWKFKAICTIENAMTRAASKEDFIAIMESEGYSVTWTDSRKYITYTCPNGMKVRDNKLHESKFLKENMQYEFAIRQQTINHFGSFEAEAEHGTGDADGDPYQPIVYAIPREDLKALLEFMRATTDFQPELFEKFGELEAKVLTQEQWDTMWNRIEKWSTNLSENVKTSANSIVPRVQDLLRENKEILSQDGKTREQFFSRLNTETDNRMEAFSDMISEMKKWIMGLIAGTGIASALFSVVICLLMR